MKKIHILILFALVFAELGKAQTCTTKSDKIITEFIPPSVPCTNFIARDNITLKPGFQFSGAFQGIPKIVELTWTFSQVYTGWAPSLTLNSITETGSAMPQNYTFDDFITSVTSLTDKYPSGWSITSLEPDFDNLKVILRVANNSDFAFSGNSNSSTVLQNYVAPADGTFNAKIDENLLFNVSYLTSIPNPETRTPDTNLPFGSVAGSLNVTPSGAATYEIPITVPKGLGGLEPKISVVYNSQVGNGLLGWGYNLSGLSAITRVPQNSYSDAGVTGGKGLTMDADDRFAMDGNRLILNNSKVYGADGAEYRTENETFMHIVSNGTYGKNSPDYFTVYAKNGTIYKYGSQGGRTLYSANSKDAVIIWYLDYVEDVFGNTVSYTYENKGLAIYLKQITYGTNKNSGGTTSTVEFFYEQRNDPINIHVYPLSGQINQVLFRVVSKTGDQILRTYNFEYSQDAYSRLTKVTEINGSNEKLNPTYLKWGDYHSSPINPSSYSLPTDAYYSQVNFSQRNWTSGDINGDGITDLISLFKYNDCSGSSCTTYNVVQPFIGTIQPDGTLSYTLGTHYTFNGNWVNDKFDNYKCFSSVSAVHNLNGDNKPDLVVPNFDKGAGVYGLISFYALGQGEFSQYMQTGTGNMPAYAIADLNNDGIEDIIYIEDTKLNTYYPGKIRLGSNDWDNDKNWIDFNITSTNAPRKIFVADYNSDGLNDIMIVNDGGYTIYLNNGDATFTGQDPVTGVFNNTCDIIRQGDFNGDGLADFVINEHNSPNWYFVINNGDLTFTNKQIIVTAQNEDFTDKDETTHNCIVTDFNNDGKSDLIVFDADYEYHRSGGSVWGTFKDFNTFWYQSTGDNVTLLKQTQSTNEADAQVNLFAPGDFDGDGRADLMNFGYDCYGGTETEQKWRLYSTPTNSEAGVITSISNGLAQNTQITYATLASRSNYSAVDATIDGTTTDGYPTYPLSLYWGNACVVKSVTTPNVIVDGVVKNIVNSYAYKNAIADVQRGFLGFSQFSVTNTKTKAIAEQNYEFSLSSGGTSYRQPFLTSTKNYVGTTLVSETSVPLLSYSVSPLATGPHHVFMYPQTSTQIDYLKNTKQTTTVSCDGDGNTLSSEVTIRGYANSVMTSVVASTKTLYNGYAKRVTVASNLNPYKNAPDNVVTEQTHKDTDGSKFSVTTAFVYDSNGKGTVQQKTDFSGTIKAITTVYTYDGVGNVLTTTTGDRIVTLEYTDDKRFVKKQYNPLYSPQDMHQYTETSCDLWGNPLIKWDLNHLQTSYTYDGWGQVTSVTSPDGSKVVSAINWIDKGNANSYKRTDVTQLYYTSSFDEDNHFIGAEYFDATGHSVRKAASGFNGRVSYSDITYNDLGQVWKVSDPFQSDGSASKWTINTYDDYGRLNLQTLQNGVTITIKPSDDIQRSITTTYSTGEVYIKEYDAAGLLTKATDPGGSISYTYYSNGKPKNIQPAGGAGATVITYNDTTGQQKTLTDPNAGTSTYYYNLFGELKSQTDGNNKTTYISYDKAGRVKTKKNGSIVTTYTYDGTGALGLLSSISKTDGSGMSYKYDDLGRVIEETSSKNSDAFTYKYEYNSKSRVSKLTYPNNMALTYGYNSISDDLTSITKDGTVIWSLGTTIDDVNELGQIKKITLGNGISTSYGYDSQNRLNSISASNIISFNYVFNDKQQLDSRDEKMFNGTSMAGFTERFKYDDANRLWTATKDNGNTPLTMTYKTGVNDRIDTKSDAATYNYPDITNHKVGYISSLKQVFARHDFTYTDEGKTATVTETNNNVVNKTLTIDYGLDGKRFKTEYTQDGSRKYTRYYFDTYEKEVMADGTSRHLNYIYAGGKLIAIFEQKTGGDKLHYVYTDYLGSLRCITSDNGTIEQRLSYDAWGNRRNYSTGLKLTDTELAGAITLTSRGFTGHEHVDGLGLINMNGRVYDPALGIFLSPDNFVQSPTNSQNFNRYTYCLNNPLMYSDPTGELLTWSFGKGGFSIGLNFTPIGMPFGFGINIGWSDGFSLGGYVEEGYRVGGTGLGSGVTISQGLDYNFKHSSWSTTTSEGAYASFGPFNAGVNFSQSYNMTNNQGSSGWGVSAGIGTGNIGFTVGYGSGGWNYGIGGSYYTDYEKAYMRAEMRNRRNINDAFSYDKYLDAQSGEDEFMAAYGSQTLTGTGNSRFIIGYTIDPDFPGVIIKKGGTLAEITGHPYYRNGMIHLPKDIDPLWEIGTVQHEYGHYLQELQLGKKTYGVYERQSFLDMIYGNDHDHFWVETDANLRSDEYFGSKYFSWYGIQNDKYWPKIPLVFKFYNIF